MILQLVDRHLVGRDHQLTIARLSDLERRPFLQSVKVRGWNRLEADEIDRGDLHRLALGNRHGDVGGILLVVELDVESGDAGVRISTIVVERLDSFQIGVETRAVEITLAAPRQLRALTGRQRVLQAGFVNGFDAFE